MKAILIILQSQKNPLITLDKLRTLIVFLLLLLSCDFNYESNDNIVARAGEKTLTNEELIEKLPKIINSEDSLIISNKIINDWALNQLLIKNAVFKHKDAIEKYYVNSDIRSPGFTFFKNWFGKKNYKTEDNDFNSQDAVFEEPIYNIINE